MFLQDISVLLQANRNRCIMHVCKNGWCVSTHHQHAAQSQPYHTSCHLRHLPVTRCRPGPGTARNCRQTSSRHSGGCRELGNQVANSPSKWNVKTKWSRKSFCSMYFLSRTHNVIVLFLFPCEHSLQIVVPTLCYVSCRSPPIKENPEMHEDVIQSAVSEERQELRHLASQT